MARRKTINVDALKKEVNIMIATSTCPKDQREGMIQVIENVLMFTGNYQGYRYLRQDEVPSFEKPGIRLNDDAFSSDDPTAKFANTDHTRVHFY